MLHYKIRKLCFPNLYPCLGSVVSNTHLLELWRAVEGERLGVKTKHVLLMLWLDDD